MERDQGKPMIIELWLSENAYLLFTCEVLGKFFADELMEAVVAKYYNHCLVMLIEHGILILSWQTN